MPNGTNCTQPSPLEFYIEIKIFSTPWKPKPHSHTTSEIYDLHLWCNIKHIENISTVCLVNLKD